MWNVTAFSTSLAFSLACAGGAFTMQVLDAAWVRSHEWLAPVLWWALEVLRAHRQEQQRDRRLFGRDSDDHNLVFRQPTGAYYSPGRLGARVVELMRKAGLEGVSLHSLRHSHASSLLSNGVPIAVVSERLGQSDQNITLPINSRALPADTKAAAKVWNDARADAIADARKPARERTLANVCTRKPANSEVSETKRKRMAGTTGFEPATSDVTGRRSNQLNYVPEV
jgi:hypothetical protein